MVEVAGAPAVCAQCGWTGRDQKAVVLENVRGVTVSGAQFPCPRCGGRARILDGSWDGTRGNVWQLRSGPPETIRRLADILADERWDLQRLQMLERALKSTARGGSDVAKVEQIERIDRSLGQLLRGALGSKEMAGLFVLLTFVLNVVVAYQSATSVDPATPEEVARIVHEELTRHEVERRDEPPVPGDTTEAPPPTR